MVEVVPPHRAQVLADPVEDDDGVVGGIAGHRQDRRNDVQTQVVAEERQERQRNQQIVDRRDHGAHAEAELETGSQIREDEKQRDERRQQTLAGKLLPDDRPDDFAAHYLITKVRLRERGLDLILRLAER